MIATAAEIESLPECVRAYPGSMRAYGVIREHFPEVTRPADLASRFASFLGSEPALVRKIAAKAFGHGRGCTFHRFDIESPEETMSNRFGPPATGPKGGE